MSSTVRECFRWMSLRLSAQLMKPNATALVLNRSLFYLDRQRGHRRRTLSLDRNGDRLSMEQHVTPRVSVLMAAYNAAEFVSEALGDLLLQSMSDFELVVVEDGSSDDTLSILKRYARQDSRIVLLEGPALRRMAVKHWQEQRCRARRNLDCLVGGGEEAHLRPDQSPGLHEDGASYSLHAGLRGKCDTDSSKGFESHLLPVLI